MKVAEIFYSLQGEGLYLGTPSVFLRLFGCNFTCGGFGMPAGEKSEERFKVDPSKYTKYEDLPLVHSGCDSYASWDPRFKGLSPMMTVEEIVDKMQSLLPDGKFGPNKHLIITGGEPLLRGWQKQIPNLIDEIIKRDMGLGHVTFETNGTQPLDNDFRYYLQFSNLEILFAVSSKLPISGEKWEDAIKPNVIKQYYWAASKIFFKWVVADSHDMEYVRKAIKEYDMPDIPVYLMPLGGTHEVYGYTHKQIAQLALENGWRYSPRLQVELWRNAWGT